MANHTWGEVMRLNAGFTRIIWRCVMNSTWGKGRWFVYLGGRVAGLINFAQFYAIGFQFRVDYLAVCSKFHLGGRVSGWINFAQGYAIGCQWVSFV